MDNSQRLFNIIMAFGAFQGKSLKATECMDGNHIGDPTICSSILTQCEGALKLMARNLRREDKEQWPDLHKLADQINKWIPENK